MDRYATLIRPIAESVGESILEHTKTKLEKVDFGEDILCEIFGWLSVPFVVSGCTLVCKEWKMVVEEVFRLDLSMDMVKWTDFVRSDKRISKRIDHLSINAEIAHYYFDSSHLACVIDSRLEAFSGLKSLSLNWVSFDDSLMQSLVTTTKIETIKLTKCEAQWSGLLPLVHSETLKCVWIDASRFACDGLLNDDCFRVLTLLNPVQSLEMAHWGNQQNGEERERFYECLVKMPNLTRLVVQIEPTLSEYLVRMPNLTHLGDTRPHGQKRSAHLLFGRLDIATILPNLTTLDVLFDGRRDIDPPKGLTHLGIVFGETSAHTVQQVSELKSIISVEYNRITVFEKCPLPNSLTQLDIFKARLTTDMVRHLSELKRLRKLKIEDCYTGYQKCITLGTLTESGVRLSETITDLFVNLGKDDSGGVLYPMSSLDTLTIDAYSEEWHDLSFIKQIPSLTCLEVNNARILPSDLSSILSKEGMRRLSLFCCNIQDFHFTDAKPNSSLKELAILRGHIGISALKWLKKMDRLTCLVIQRCALHEYSANVIASMKGLRVLLAEYIRIGAYKYHNSVFRELDSEFECTMEIEEWSKRVQSNESLVLFANERPWKKA